MGCSDCIHYSYCMERRGICREFKTLEMIRREINALNENQKTATTIPTDSHEDGAE